ncbi:MAG: tetratricopeptide repeat protein [bacterium]|nr:tetratricopeptide repeat protein [bacterium]
MNVKLITHLTTLLFFVIAFTGKSQVHKGGRSFYLIDSVEPSKYNEYDNYLLDSLLTSYHSTTNDTIRLNAIKGLSESLNDQVLWPKYNNLLLNMTKARTDSLGMVFYGNALNNLGFECQYLKNNIEKALEYYEQSYAVFEKLKFESGMAVELNNLAYIYQHQGNMEKSIDLFSKVEAIFRKLDNPLGQTSAMINLGDIYYNNNETETAEDYFKKALVFAQATKNEQIIANVYNQLGAINARKKDTLKAIYYFEKSLEIYTKYENYSRMALSELSSANQLDVNKQGVLAERKFLNSARNARLSNDLQVKSKVYDYVAFFYLKSKNNSKALIYSDSAYLFAKQVGYPDLILNAAKKLSELFHKNGKHERAYQYLLEAYTMNDSIYNDKFKNTLLKQQFKLDYSKKEMLLKAEEEKKDAVREAERKEEERVMMLTFFALLVITAFALMAFLNYRKAKRAAVTIQNQKFQVELQKEEISIQKLAVEQKQREIIDSITYARLIQRAVLTGNDVWKKVSKEHFILFQPKDIVSGDFYWAHVTQNNRAIFAMADCTGHGVPGGFMSMLGNSFLNELIVENKLFKSNEILNRLREKIISALSQEGGMDQKDGMDLSLCVWNKIDNTLEFSGANNALWLLRNNVITEYKGDKMPIGAYVDETRGFSSETIQLQQGDLIYLTTDGFADQFGGPKGKKFKYKPMMDLLINIQAEDMATQTRLLETALTDWKMHYEQVDDISVIGIRV